MKSIQNSGFGPRARNGAGAAVLSPRTESVCFSTRTFGGVPQDPPPKARDLHSSSLHQTQTILARVSSGGPERAAWGTVAGF